MLALHISFHVTGIPLRISRQVSWTIQSFVHIMKFMVYCAHVNISFCANTFVDNGSLG